MYARIHGKTTDGIIEDEVTSCVFGPLRMLGVLEPPTAWTACLHLFQCGHLFPNYAPTDVDVRFWPRFPPGQRGYIEPDVHVIGRRGREAGEHADFVWPHAKRPLVYVAFHRYPDPGSDEVSYYGVIKTRFGLDQHGKPYHEGEDVPYRASAPLWIWDDIPDDVGEWIDSSWFFAVPMVEIGSYDALREQITEPLRQLLFENRSSEDVFRDRRAIPTVAAEGP